MKTIAEYSADVETALRALSFPGGKLASLYQPIEYALSAGGKRIRPVLTLMGPTLLAEMRQRLCARLWE